MNTTSRPTRFLNAALVEVADSRGLTYEEWGGGWIARIGNRDRFLGAFGYQLSLNSAVAASISRDKAGASERLERDGVAVVPTALALTETRQRWLDGRSAAEALDQTLDNLELPLVVKPNEGSSGEGVTLCLTRAEARARTLELLEQEPSVAIQPFLRLSSEERWVLLDGVPLLRYVKREAPTVGPLRVFNLAMGGGLAETGIERGTSEARALALRAMQSIGIRIGAVDLAWTVEGDLEVLEVNSGVSFEHLLTIAPDLRADALAVYRAAAAAALLCEAH